MIKDSSPSCGTVRSNAEPVPRPPWPRAIRRQWWIARLCFPAFGLFFHFLLSVVAAYRIADLKRFRKEVACLVDGHDGPVIISANHLTMIDSLVIMWALFPFSSYLRDFRRLPWNMPEARNFARNLWLRTMCYLGKCVYVTRGGALASRRATVETFKSLLSQGEWILIFPEGGRSRTGMVDPEVATYTVGELFLATPNARLLCVYARGEAQKTWGALPKRGDVFHLYATLVAAPEALALGTGRRAAREVAQTITSTLVALEQKWFHNPARQERSQPPRLPHLGGLDDALGQPPGQT